MGNSHGHRKHRNGAHRTVTANSPFKYGPSDQQAQSPSSAKPTMVTLPYSRVDSSLRALAAQAEGFGRLAIGGLHGPLYHVTTLAGNFFKKLNVYSLSHSFTSSNSLCKCVCSGFLEIERQYLGLVSYVQFVEVYLLIGMVKMF